MTAGKKAAADDDVGVQAAADADRLRDAGKKYASSVDVARSVFQISRLMGGVSARIESGAVSRSAMNTGSRMWQPKSPSWPLEKSCQARQLNE